MTDYTYTYTPAVAELLEDLAQRGIQIRLTNKGPVIDFNGEDLSDHEAEVLTAHRWNLWRYLPPPTACLQCGGPLHSARSWECQECLDRATGWVHVRVPTKQKGVA